MFYVYVLRSEQDGNLYIGSTANVEVRLAYHNSGRVRSTKSRRPFELVYREEFQSKRQARKRELFLKTGQGRKFLQEVLNGTRLEQQGGSSAKKTADPPPA